MENLKIEDLIEGEIYYGKDSYKDVIFKPKKCEIYENKYFYRGNSPTVLTNLREATLEEKHWLNCCIKENKFVPYEKAIETFNNETIEIGDEVEVTEKYHDNDAKVGSKGVVVKIDNHSNIKYCIRNETFPRQKSSWCINVKLIKKAKNNTTHVNKKVDIFSPVQVGNEITNITIPKSASVVLKNTENEVKIKINLKQTIKL